MVPALDDGGQWSDRGEGVDGESVVQPLADAISPTESAEGDGEPDGGRIGIRDVEITVTDKREFPKVQNRDLLARSHTALAVELKRVLQQAAVPDGTRIAESPSSANAAGGYQKLNGPSCRVREIKRFEKFNRSRGEWVARTRWRRAEHDLMISGIEERLNILVKHFGNDHDIATPSVA